MKFYRWKQLLTISLILQKLINIFITIPVEFLSKIHKIQKILTQLHDIKWLVSLEDVPKNCKPYSVIVYNGHLGVRLDYSSMVCQAVTFGAGIACQPYFCQIACRHCE